MAKRVGNIIYDVYCKHTGEFFSTTCYAELPDGVVVDGVIWFENKPELGGGYSKRNFTGPASVKWFGAGFGADDTDAIQKAVNSGFNLFFDAGIYLVGSSINIPTLMRGKSISGSGYYHYDSIKSTVIKSTGNYDCFIIGDGCDCLTFEGIRFEGNNIGKKGINATYGSFLAINNCGFYNYTEHGTFARQGLGRYTKSFWAGNKVGAEIYSDSSITDCEFSLGEIPLLISAGGNRLVNVWANSGSKCCVELRVLDLGTSHINTSIVNLYAGEVYLGDGFVPIIKISGLSGQKIQQVQISNSHIVNAAANVECINGGILMDYVDGCSISNIQFLGLGEYANSDVYTEYFLKATNSTGINVSNCGVTKSNKSAIQILEGCEDFSINGNNFKNCSANIAVGTEGANIINEGANRLSVQDNIFTCTSGSAVPYAIESIDYDSVIFSNNLISYANSIIANGLRFSGINKQNGGQVVIENSFLNNVTIGSNNVNQSGKNFTSKTTGSASGGGTISFFEIPVSAENKTYLITVMQSGSGSNGTTGILFAYNSSFGIVTTGNTNSNPVLQNTLIIDDGFLKMTIGSGYGSTTFECVLTSLG